MHALVATRSAGKLRELMPLLRAAGYEVVDLATAGVAELAEEEALERYDTFEANALAKARYFAQRCGAAVFADDSGLEVDALSGRPGVHSKRWSGRTELSGAALDDANTAVLLGALEGAGSRRARYVCVAAFAVGDIAVSARGECSGEILAGARGRGGFGYDPVFWSDDLAMTFGEAHAEDKARVSHRGRAFRALVAQLRAGR